MINDMQSIERDGEGNLRVKSAATWVTDDESVPDPEVEVLNESVLIRPLTLGSKIKTKSGVEFYTPEKSMDIQQNALTVGRVIGVGQYAGKRQNVSRVERGDFVLFPKYGGARVTFKGVKCIFMPDDAIMARVKPEDVQLDVTI